MIVGNLWASAYTPEARKKIQETIATAEKRIAKEETQKKKRKNKQRKG